MFSGVELVIFDMDQTLVDSKLCYKSLHELILDKFAVCTKNGILEAIEGMDLPEREAAMNDVENWELGGLENACMVNNAIYVLEELFTRGIKLGLFTRNNEKVMCRAMELFDIQKFFDSWASRDYGQEVKPHPQHILHIMDNLDVDPKKTVVVGDWTFDVECGKRAGALTVGFQRHENYPAEFFEHCDHVIRDLTELVSLIEN
ncbi:hypothetical protein PCE1_001188 [Barthelona sp. PCE]